MGKRKTSESKCEEQSSDESQSDSSQEEHPSKKPAHHDHADHSSDDESDAEAGTKEISILEDLTPLGSHQWDLKRVSGGDLLQTLDLHQPKGWAVSIPDGVEFHFECPEGGITGLLCRKKKKWVVCASRAHLDLGEVKGVLPRIGESGEPTKYRAEAGSADFSAKNPLKFASQDQIHVAMLNQDEPDCPAGEAPAGFSPLRAGDWGVSLFFEEGKYVVPVSLWFRKSDDKPARSPEMDADFKLLWDRVARTSKRPAH